MGNGRKRRTWYKEHVRRKRWRAAKPWVIFGGVATVVAAGSAYVFSPEPAPVATPTPVVTAHKTTPSKQPVAAFLGDSYTDGAGASSRSNRWTTIVNKELGTLQRNLGVGGTGYVTKKPYETRLGRATWEDPAYVFVAGGQNDFPAYVDDPTPVEDAIESLYVDLRESLPDATIVAVGPSTPGTVSDAVVAFDQAVQGAAEAVNAEYVSLIEPNVLTPDMLTIDGVHVDDTGHAAIAERILDTLR